MGTDRPGEKQTTLARGCSVTLSGTCPTPGQLPPPQLGLSYVTPDLIALTSCSFTSSGCYFYLYFSPLLVPRAHSCTWLPSPRSQGLNSALFWDLSGCRPSSPGSPSSLKVPYFTNVVVAYRGSHSWCLTGYRDSVCPAPRAFS